MKKYLITLSLLITGCYGEEVVKIPEDIAAMQNVAVYSGDADPIYSITLEKTALFGDTDDLFLRSIGGITVSDSGDLYLADSQEGSVHVYDEFGSHTFSIGRKGEGPGEFTRADRPQLFNGELYVLDVQQQRVSVFDPNNGQFLRNISMGGGSQDISGFPVNFEAISENRFLAFYNSMQQDGERFLRKEVLRVLDEDGKEIASDFIEFEAGEMFMIRGENSIQIMSLPFMRDTHSEINSNEQIVWGYSDRIFLQFVSLDGEYIRSVYHSKENPPLDRAAMLSRYEDPAVRESIRSLDIPETRPAFQYFRIDDENRIWISLNTEDEDENEIWVLDPDGEKLAQFTRPSVNRLLLVKDSYAYFHEENEDGLQEVVKYRVEIN
ncbi:MAG: 6-bladed beta-propeller [Balneolaceae bacterium]|nr:6-bladed beta-propeller [Balneolaceae bacterium]